MFNPEPPSVVDGPPFLYDATLHLEPRRLGLRELPHLRRLRQPGVGPRQSRTTSVTPIPGPFTFDLALIAPFTGGQPPIHHPLKGPMTTQSLRGMANHGPMHWRGDRTGGTDATR